MKCNRIHRNYMSFMRYNQSRHLEESLNETQKDWVYACGVYMCMYSVNIIITHIYSVVCHNVSLQIFFVLYFYCSYIEDEYFIQ